MRLHEAYKERLATDYQNSGVVPAALESSLTAAVTAIREATTIEEALDLRGADSIEDVDYAIGILSETMGHTEFTNAEVSQVLKELLAWVTGGVLQEKELAERAIAAARGIVPPGFDPNDYNAKAETERVMTDEEHAKVTTQLNSSRELGLSPEEEARLNERTKYHILTKEQLGEFCEEVLDDLRKQSKPTDDEQLAQLRKELQEIAALQEERKGEPEDDHVKADTLLIEFIGDPKVKEAYDRLQKFYA